MCGVVRRSQRAWWGCRKCGSAHVGDVTPRAFPYFVDCPIAYSVRQSLLNSIFFCREEDRGLQRVFCAISSEDKMERPIASIIELQVIAQDGCATRVSNFEGRDIKLKLLCINAKNGRC